MILLISSFITNKRGINRYSRYDIFKYMLYSYQNIPFTEIYLCILLDDEFLNKKDELLEYIYSTFSKIDKINIMWNRYTKQEEWIPFIENIKLKHGLNELVWFSQNDDHIFIDFNNDVLNEGLKLLQKENNKFKSIYISHWPEILKLSGKKQEPILINNYIKFNLSLLDSIQIFNLNLLYYVFVEYKWKNKEHIRIDSVLNELTKYPSQDNPLNQVIYVPLRELVRHFDGYEHTRMDKTYYPLLELPSNTFKYDREFLRNKMTPYHSSVWTKNNLFKIPEKWIDINASLHPSNLSQYVLDINKIKRNVRGNVTIINENEISKYDISNMTPISIGWNNSLSNYNEQNKYLACPFDLCITPMNGLYECIMDDFDRKKFFNLRIEYDSINKQEYILNEYDMWFNHETEEKYTENDYELFKEIYEYRIQNFFNYIEKSNVLFIIKKSYYQLNHLINFINYKYPYLEYKILVLNETDKLFYKQYLHSPGFPTNKNDFTYLYKYNKKIKDLYKINNIEYNIPHYRAVILILASNNNNIYKNFRKIWKAYMKKDPTIRVFFVYGKLTEPLLDFDNTSDIVFEDIEESYPIFIKKTIEAMKIININVSYDFFIRTNISTFWDFKKLHLHLNELPTTNCYSGDGPLNGKGYDENGFYLSGVDTIVTPEMIDNMICNEDLIKFDIVEDAAMGCFFNGIMGAPMLPNRICFFEDIISINEINKIEHRINTAIKNNKNHYRIKTLNGNREEIDFLISKILLKKIYNISI